MMNRKLVAILTVGIGLTMMALFAIPARAEEAPRITKEDLRAMLGDPDLVILDVRLGTDWEAGKRKITGAIRQNPSEFESWANQYSRDKTLVLYCA